MAKYKLKNTLVGGFRDVNCNILHESAGSYVVQFENGVVRRVPKRRVYRLNRIDEGVLDTIRDAGKRLFSGLKKVGKYVAAFICGEKQPVSSPINAVITAKNIDGMSVVLSSETAALAKSLGVNDTAVIDDEITEDDLAIESFWKTAMQSLKTLNLQEGVYYKSSRRLNEDDTYDTFKSSFQTKYRDRPTPKLTRQDKFQFAPRDNQNQLDAEYGKYISLNDEDRKEYLLDLILRDSNAKERYEGGSNDDVAEIAGGQTVRTVGSDELIEEIATRVERRIENGDKAPTNDTLVIWGVAGVGKSSFVRQIAERKNRNFRGLFGLKSATLSSMVKNDFSLPDIDEISDDKNIGSKKVSVSVATELLPCYRICTPETLPAKLKHLVERKNEPIRIGELVKRVNICRDIDANGGSADIDSETGEINVIRDGAGGIIFFDEISRVTADVLNVVMQLIESREYNGSRIGSRWEFIMAGNRLKDMEDPDASSIAMTSADTFTWDSALSGRTFSVNLIPSFDSWCDWWKEKGFDPNILKFIKNNLKLWVQRKIDIPSFAIDANSNRVADMASPRNWASFAENIKTYLEDCKRARAFQTLVDEECGGSVKKALKLLWDRSENGTFEDMKTYDTFERLARSKNFKKYLNTQSVYDIPYTEVRDRAISTVGYPATAHFMKFYENSKNAPDEVGVSAWTGHPLKNVGTVANPKYEINNNLNYITPRCLDGVFLPAFEGSIPALIDVLSRTYTMAGIKNTTDSDSVYPYYINVLKFFIVVAKHYDNNGTNIPSLGGYTNALKRQFDDMCGKKRIAIPDNEIMKDLDNWLEQETNLAVNSNDDDFFKELYTESIEQSEQPIEESFYFPYRNRLRSRNLRYSRRYRVNESLDDENGMETNDIHDMVPAVYKMSIPDSIVHKVKFFSHRYGIVLSEEDVIPIYDGKYGSKCGKGFELYTPNSDIEDEHVTWFCDTVQKYGFLIYKESPTTYSIVYKPSIVRYDKCSDKMDIYFDSDRY